MGSMNNTQFFILLGTILAGVIWQRVDYHQLSGRLDNVSTELHRRIDQLGGRMDHISDTLTGRIDRISDDLKQFYRDLGRHEEALDNLKNKE